MKDMPLFNVNGAVGQSGYHATDFHTVADFINHLDYLEIDRSLVWHYSARDLSPAFGNAKLLDEIEEAGAGDRLLPAFVITPSCLFNHGVMDSLKAAMASKQVRALRLEPVKGQFPIRHIERVLGELADYKPLVLWDVTKDDQSFRDLDFLAEKFPQVNFAVTQFIWGPFGFVLDLMWRRPNTYMDISWLHTRGAIELVCKEFGAERILFGVGFKAHYGAAISTLAFAEISEDERALIAHGNVERLLDLPAHSGRLVAGNPFDVKKPLWDRFKQGERLIDTEIIDAHGHDELPHMGLFYEETTLEENRDALIRQSERLGIRQTILCSGTALFSDGVEGNRLMERVFSGQGEMFKGYLAFNPRFSDQLVPLLDDFFSRDFYVGFKLLAGYWKIPMNDPSYRPVWEYADKHRLPILMHTWAPGWDSPAILTDIVREFPNAIFVLGHSGGPSRAEGVELARNNDNVVLEFCGSFTIPDLYEDAIKEVGIEKVVFGSDTAMHNVAWELGRLLSLPLDDDALLPALAENMKRILSQRQ